MKSTEYIEWDKLEQIERTAAVSADIEGLAVFLYFLHDFLGT